MSKTSYRRYSIKKAVLKNFAIFLGKHLSWGLFLIKLQGWGACNFIKKRLRLRCFPFNIAKFLRTPANGWMGSSANNAEWVDTPLYKNKSIFVCVSVDQALKSNEKDVTNLKLSDLLSRKFSITLINLTS